MATNKKKKIPQLPEITTLPNTGKIPISYNGVTYYILAEKLTAEIGSNLRLEDLIDELDPQEGDTLVFTNNEWVVAPAGSDVFENDFTLILSGSKSFGKYINGQTVPAAGKTAREVILEAAVEYLIPTFTSFDISDEASVVETGYRVTGSTTFTWATSNPTNVEPNTVDLIDVTNANLILASGLDNDGSETITLPSDVYYNTPGSTNQWKVQAQNTELDSFDTTTTITWRNKLFYAPASSDPITSNDVRTLGNEAFYSGSTTFILNTGSILTDFYVALPPGKTITSVVDLDALNAVITASYVLLGTINVDDIGTPANTFAYNLYKMHIAVPYSSNHRHSITTSS